MKFLFDVLPGIIFLVVLFTYPGEQPIYAATASLMLAMVIQSLLLWWRYKKVATSSLIICAVVLVLGGITLWLQDAQFIKWKPTLVFWCFAAACALSEYLCGGISLPQRLLQRQFDPPAVKWFRVNLSCVAFFVLLGLLNLYVAYQFDTETWAMFKVFGTMAINLVFMVGVIVYLYPHMQIQDEAKE